MTVHRRSNSTIRIVWFEAIAWTGEPKNAEPDVHEKIEWLELDALPENVIDYMSFALENIAEDSYYGEFDWE